MHETTSFERELGLLQSQTSTREYQQGPLGSALGFDAASLSEAARRVTLESVMALIRGPLSDTGVVHPEPRENGSRRDERTRRDVARSLYRSFDVPDTIPGRVAVEDVLPAGGTWRTWDPEASDGTFWTAQGSVPAGMMAARRGRLGQPARWGMGGGFFFKVSRHYEIVDFWRNPWEGGQHRLKLPVVLSAIREMVDPTRAARVISSFVRLARAGEFDAALTYSSAYRQGTDAIFRRGELDTYDNFGLDNLWGDLERIRSRLRLNFPATPYCLEARDRPRRIIIELGRFRQFAREAGQPLHSPAAYRAACDGSGGVVPWNENNEPTLPAVIRASDAIVAYGASLMLRAEALNLPRDVSPRARRVWVRAQLSGDVHGHRAAAERSGRLEAVASHRDLLTSHAVRKARINAAEAEIMDALLLKPAATIYKSRHMPAH